MHQDSLFKVTVEIRISEFFKVNFIISELSLQSNNLSPPSGIVPGNNTATGDKNIHHLHKILHIGIHHPTIVNISSLKLRFYFALLSFHSLRLTKLFTLFAS